LANDDVAKVGSIIRFLKQHQVIGGWQIEPKVVALVTNLAGYANAFFFGNSDHDDEMFGDFLADKWEPAILKLGYASFTDEAKSDAAGEEPDGVIRLRLDKYLEGISSSVNPECKELLRDKEYEGIEFGDRATEITWTSKVLPKNMVGIDLLSIDEGEFEIALAYPKAAQKYLDLYNNYKFEIEYAY
jgi:hypothetical protein